MKTNKNFKGLDYYGLQQDNNGNIKLNDYKDVINARRARVDMLLDNTKSDDVNFVKLNKALDEKLTDSQSTIKEDEEIAQEKSKIFAILDNLNDLSNIDSHDLLEVSLFLSDLSYIEKSIMFNQDSELAELKDLFLEKKASGEDYTDEEYKDFIDYIDRANNIIKLELSDRIDKR